MKPYAEETERLMKTLFERLSEKDRRRYAAVEEEKLGWGGIEYISGLLGIDSRTISRGLSDLRDAADGAPGRVRKKGVDAKG